MHSRYNMQTKTCASYDYCSHGISGTTPTCEKAQALASLAAGPHFQQWRQLTRPQLGQLLTLGLAPTPHVLQGKETRVDFPIAPVLGSMQFRGDICSWPAWPATTAHILQHNLKVCAVCYSAQRLRVHSPLTTLHNLPTRKNPEECARNCACTPLLQTSCCISHRLCRKSVSHVEAAAGRHTLLEEPDPQRLLYQAHTAAVNSLYLYPNFYQLAAHALIPQTKSP
jgi:hypothetical protein